MPSDRPDPSEFLANGPTDAARAVRRHARQNDEPWAEATRGSASRRARGPSAERQRENLTFALATRAVEALEDLALNVAAIRQRLERTTPARTAPPRTRTTRPGSDRAVRPRRARAQEMFDVSATIVVSAPWPVRTTVSPGRVSSRERMDRRIVGSSL